MLIITGLLRSGTSRLAKMAQQMNICMGATTSFSAPGTEIEYEDFLIIHPLSSAAFERKTLKDPVGLLRRYIRDRQQRHKCKRQLYKPEYITGWGLKSPYLMLYWDALKAAAAAESEPLKIVLTHRPIAEVHKSIELIVGRMSKQYHREWERKFKDVIARMRAVRSRVKEEADVEIPLSETRKDPTIPARKIAALMGIDMKNEYQVVRGIY
jgi:hypothetical protein